MASTKAEEAVAALIASGGSIRGAARMLGIHHSSFKERLDHARFNGVDVDSALAIVSKPPEFYKPILIKSGKETCHIIAIGDLHDSPSLPDKSRMKWIARLVGETNPDFVVQIGDIADFDSCSAHAPPGSTEHSMRPSYQNDLDSLDECLNEYYKILPDGPKKRVVCGNHEYRIRRFENLHPEVEGGFYSQLDDVFARYGWRNSEYGQWLFIDDVGFVHVPFNAMGKEYGGKNPENTVANDAIFSLVFGHTHKMSFKKVPKIGPNQSVEVLNLGSAMPDGLVKKYASRSTTGWTYGVWELWIRGGHIVDHNFHSMARLKERFS